MSFAPFEILDGKPQASMTFLGRSALESKATKPSLDEVIKYATPQIRKFIGKFAADLPMEQREEIEQDGILRIIRAYDNLDVSLGWKSFIYTHCEGSVKDYLRFGKGFHESRWSLALKPGEDTKFGRKIRDRVSLEFDGESIDIDQIIGAHGVFSEMKFDEVQIRWELVARMASQDEVLHAFAKSLLGYGIEQMAPVFGLCRARVGQLIQAFVERFDDPDLADCPWFKQTCYAFGICTHLGMKDIDQSEVMGFSIGWGLPQVDLDDLKPCLQILEDQSQMNFFGEDLDG